MIKTFGGVKLKENITKNDYDKLYYAENKNNIKAKMLTKEKCKECDKDICHGNMLRHLKNVHKKI